MVLSLVSEITTRFILQIFLVFYFVSYSNFMVFWPGANIWGTGPGPELENDQLDLFKFFVFCEGFSLVSEFSSRIFPYETNFFLSVGQWTLIG